MRHKTLRQDFIRTARCLCAFIKLSLSLLYLSSRVFDRRISRKCRMLRHVKSPALPSISVVSIMQIRPASTAKEETIYISRKYTCHRDVNRALVHKRRRRRRKFAWQEAKREKSKGDREQRYIEREKIAAKAALEGSSPISMSAETIDLNNSARNRERIELDSKG